MSHPNRRTVLLQGFAGALALGVPFTARAAPIKPDAASALIVVDVQNCFVTGGTLPVAKGEEVVPVINKLAKSFENIVLTQDWHTPGHASFASSHAGKKPFETTKLSYGTQVLWPDHCVQGTPDAALHKDLDLPTAQVIVRKGYRKHMDSYSAFDEADHKTPTGLAGHLKQRGIKRVFVTGLATDFCVAWTAMGRAPPGLRDLGDRGRDPRHRPERLARRGLETDGGQGREAHQGGRYRRGLTRTGSLM